MRIDVHAHYWPAAYLDALVDHGRTDLVKVGRQKDDFDQRLETLDRNGVQLQLLSAIGINVELAEPGPAAETSRLINDIYAEVSTRYPGRFAAFGSVPLPHVDAAIAETERCYDELGVVGIALPCIVGGKPIDHVDYEPFWENLARHDAVVYVHPAGADSLVHPGLADFNMTLAFGSPLQISVAPVRIVMSGLSTRHPSLRFVFAMGAANLPYLWPRIERNIKRGFARSAVAAVGNHMSDYLAKLPIDPKNPLAKLTEFWYDTGIQDVPGALLAARETYGVDRVVLGSDEIFASLDDAVAFVRDSPYLSDAEKTAILDTNAGQALGDALKVVSTR